VTGEPLGESSSVRGQGEGKLSSTVLRGLGADNSPRLPDCQKTKIKDVK